MDTCKKDAGRRIFTWSSVKREIHFRIYDPCGRFAVEGSLDKGEFHHRWKVPMLRWVDGDGKLRNGEQFVGRMRLASELSTEKFVGRLSPLSVKVFRRGMHMQANPEEHSKTL